MASLPGAAAGRGHDTTALARLTRVMQRTLESGTRKVASISKGSYQRARYDRAGSKTIGLVMGAQRSGTGMLVQAFENDWACRTFGEDGGLALGPGAPSGMRWRWKPLDEVAGILRDQCAPLLIAKPLVESQRAEEILRALPEARFIWAYRHYQNVALSGQEHFGSEVIRHNLTSILQGHAHWYAEHVSEAIRALVAQYFTPGRSVYDLRALGWYVRNSHVFRYRHLPVMLSNYEDLVADPAVKMRGLYDFLGHLYPGDHIVRHIHSRSAMRGSRVRISADIRELCDAMMAALARHASVVRSRSSAAA